MRSRIAKGILACLFFVHSVPSLGQDYASISNDAPALVMSSGDKQKPLLTETQVIEQIDPEEIGEIARDLAEKTGQQVLISTDSEEVIQDVVKDFDDQNIKNTKFEKVKKPKFLAFGRALKEKVSSEIQETKANIKKHWLGLAITVVTTGYDTIYWLHASDLETSQKYMLITYNWLINLKFGIDPDSWTQMTEKVDDKISVAFEKFGIKKKSLHGNSGSSLARRYLSNMSLYFAVNATRFGILNLDHLGESLHSANFWVPLLTVTGAASFTSFGWGEFSNRIKESKHPLAKRTVHIFSYLRQTFMGFAAPSSGLINGHSPGPWAAVVGHGVLGFIAFKFRPQITHLIEKNDFVTWVKEKWRPQAVNSCTAVF